MLGKLFKHEWRSTWKMPTALCAFTVIMTLLGMWSFKMPFWQKIVGNNTNAVTFWDLMAFVILITYFVSIVISAFAIMIYFAIRFYKNMFTDEGYLTHTLPVKASQLITSKLLVSSIWNLIASAVMLISMALLLVVFIHTLTGPEIFSELMVEFEAILPDIDRAFREYGGMSLGLNGVIYILLIVFGCFSSMLLIYLCICIGQLVRKHKVAASILAYLVVTTIIQTVTSIASLPISFNMISKMDSLWMIDDPMVMMVGTYAAMTPLYFFSIILTLVLSAASYFVCVYLTKRKLNLD